MGKVQRGVRVVVASALVAAASFVIRADATPSSQASEIQLQLGNLLFGEGHYGEALDAYQNALKEAAPDQQQPARTGVIQMALHTAEFDLARHEAETLIKAHPRSPDALALYADALWSSGLFEEAESKYRDALSIEIGRAHV